MDDALITQRGVRRRGPRADHPKLCSLNPDPAKGPKARVYVKRPLPDDYITFAKDNARAECRRHFDCSDSLLDRFASDSGVKPARHTRAQRTPVSRDLLAKALKAFH